MRSSSFVAVSCSSGLALEKDSRGAALDAALDIGALAASLKQEGPAAAVKQEGYGAARCIECGRLEAEFVEARDRLRNLTRLRRLTALEEKQLIDRVAMAIARMKEHEARHDGDRCKKGLVGK